MKKQEYDELFPLERLEKGDKAIIKVRYLGVATEKDFNKYKDVPDGVYEAVCVGNGKLECKEYPVLSGKYNWWMGDKWGCTYGIYADEKKSINTTQYLESK